MLPPDPDLPPRSPRALPGNPCPSSPRRRGPRLWRLGVAAALAALALAGAASPAAAAPDLFVDSIEADPDSGPNGTAVEISIRIRNQGDEPADETVTRVRINQDPGAVVSTDPQICNLQTPAILAGGFADVGCTPVLSGRPPGANYIWAIADVNDSAGQDDRSNDRRSELFTVNDQAPDLVVQDIVLDPSSARNGDPVIMLITLRNDGTATALPSTTRLRINQDASAVATTDPQICNITTPSVLAGASVDVSCTPTLSGRPPGTNYVWAIADVNNTAGQVDRTNDRASAPLQVSSVASDLIVESVVASPAAGGNGDSINITATIRNQGNATAFASTTRFRINEDPDTVGGGDFQLCPPVETKAIQVGQIAEVKCKTTLEDRPSGPNYIWAIADTSDTAGQSDRTNDRGKVEFIVDPPPTPDLSVRTITVNPVSGANGDTVTISARIGNEGDLASPATKTRFTINQDADDTVEGDTVLCSEVSVVALSPGASVLVNCKPVLADLSIGLHHVWATADATGVAAQVNFDNDKLAAEFTVTPVPGPDLVVQSVTALPSSAKAGQAVSITVRIRNQGNESASSSSARVRLGRSAAGVLETDEILCNSVATPGVAAGASVDVLCPWVVGAQVPGPAFLWATADVTDTAGQDDRSNDSGSGAFTVLAPDGPDLVVQRLSVRPSIARNGDTLIVKARVFNRGNEAAAASVTSFRINQDATGVDEGDDILCQGVSTPALPVGEGVRVRCVVALAGRSVGEHFVWAVADTTDTSGQVDPSNDRRRTTLTVVTSLCGGDGAPLLSWPVEEPRVIQDYASFGSVPLGGGRLGYHSGVDLLSHLPLPADQTPVYAAADGEVVAVRATCPSPADPLENPPNGRCGAGWGNYLVLRHGDGVYTTYAHLGAVFARRGCVTRGQRIALAGSSGSTDIPVHLHFGAMADLVEPVRRKALGNEYYRRFHPFLGRKPESATGEPMVHLDPRDFMTRSRVRITEAVVASRGAVTGGEEAFLGKGQRYVSLGELVPGYFCIDLPGSLLPEDGPPYADDSRYGWVPAAFVEVVQTGLAPGSLRIDGLAAFVDEGVGANFVALRDEAADASAEVSKAWGGQHFAPSGNPVPDRDGGSGTWQKVDVPGTSASGDGRPREAFLPTDMVGPPPAY